ncbi:MAG: DUF3847 domain-containing protein [Oscillospiraceae bacterium]|nr:DUF3847 domain-containing protein [Oscillospiraceae bacterium]
MKQKSLPQLEAELLQHEQAVQAYEKKVSQLENQLSKSVTRYKNQERRIRTHRLIERGAIFESLIPNADSLTNEQVKALLSVALDTAEARAFLEKVALVKSTK